MIDTVSRPTILVVENDEETRRLYADILGAMGADILEAGNPCEAFEHLRSRPVALVVTDLGVEILTTSKISVSQPALPHSCDYRAERGASPARPDHGWSD